MKIKSISMGIGISGTWISTELRHLLNMLSVELHKRELAKNPVKVKKCKKIISMSDTRKVQ